MAQALTTARIRQRRRQRLLLLMLLLLMLLGGAAYFLLQQQAVESRAQVVPPGAVAVPVARAPLRIGTKLSLNEHMRLRYYPPLEVPPDALLKPFQFDQRVLLRDLRAGDYLRASDLSESEAPSSFSGVARPGMRVVVVGTDNIEGVAASLRAGDRVDVVLVGWGVAVGDARAAARPSTVSVAGGGIHPGDPGAAGRAGAAGPVGSGNALLVAENAEVLAVSPARPRQTGGYAVLQMAPSDAHKTLAALAAGAMLRFAFRHFDEKSRVVEADPLEQTVYLPLAARTVEVIAGATRSHQQATVGR